jgi:hypothetical protein
MRKPILILLLFFLTNSLFAQSWLWAQAAVNNNLNSWSDPLALVTDSKGNVYETGDFYGNVSFGSKSISCSGNPIYGDAYLVKFDALGNVLWADSAVTKRNNWGWGWSLAIDDFGNSYITGWYTDTIAFGPYTLISAPNMYGNAFIAKIDSNGRVCWARTSTTSTTSNVTSRAIVTDKMGCIYIGGEFTDTVKFGPFNLVSGDSSGVFLVKYDTSGNVIWAREGTSSLSYLNGIVSLSSDASNNVYMSGTFIYDMTFGSNCFTANASNFFVVKYDNNGNLIWGTSGNNSTYVDGSNGIPIAVDASGNICVAGSFQDTLKLGSYSMGSDKNSNIFIVKYNPLGKVIWAENSFIPSQRSYAYTYSLATDKWRNIYLSGRFQDTVTLDWITLVGDTALPAFLFKLDSMGHSQCGALIHNYNDDISPVAADPLSDNVYLSGDVFSSVLAGNSLSKYSYCAFGSDTIRGKGSEYAFLAKWKCSAAEGINEVSENKEATLYPNPNNGRFTIELQGVRDKEQVEIYNMLGEKIYEETLRQTQGDNAIDLGTKSSGVYLYRIVSETGTQIANGKFVIE